MIVIYASSGVSFARDIAFARGIAYIRIMFIVHVTAEIITQNNKLRL